MGKDAVLKIASLLVALRCGASLCAFGAGSGEGPIADQVIKLSTGVIEREWAIRDGVFRTTRIRSLERPAEWSIHEAAEFRMELEGGRKIDTSAFCVRSCSRLRVGNADTVVLELAGRDQPDCRVKISLRAEAGKSFLTKTIGFRSPDRVDRIEVESLPKPGPLALGGLGQPLFIADEWFIGSEHPAGINNAERSELFCALHPGCLQRDGMSTVVGCRDAADHSIDDAFRRYVDTFMPPVGPQLQYNSWFDLRDREVDPGKLAERFDSFQVKLLQPYGLQFDAFVIDDGFQNPKSIWQLNERWQSNIVSLREKVQATGSRLGLWLPLNGHKLDVGFGAQHLLEASNNRKPAYCLAGSKYRAALEAAIASLLDKGNFAYFKHDFNFLRCSAAGHGHLETAEHGRQAGVDGQLGNPELGKETTTESGAQSDEQHLAKPMVAQIS